MPGRLLHIETALQGTPLSSHPGSSPSQTDHAPAQSEIGKLRVLSPEYVVEMTADGPDYWRRCKTHSWYSLNSPRLDELPMCPHCRLDLEERNGRLRFAAMEMRLRLGL